jgi:hypothetical protein
MNRTNSGQQWTCSKHDCSFSANQSGSIAAPAVGSVIVIFCDREYVRSQAAYRRRYGAEFTVIVLVIVTVA